jgi:NADH-quinone oxidoreductase subunit A
MNGILFYITIMFLITCVVAGLPFLLQSANAKDFERVSAYECGFEPFSSARDVFDIQFYLVGIMFIVFDIEIAFLFP